MQYEQIYLKQIAMEISKICKGYVHTSYNEGFDSITVTIKYGAFSYTYTIEYIKYHGLSGTPSKELCDEVVKNYYNYLQSILNKIYFKKEVKITRQPY